jgi:hypothetical protein
MKTRSKFLALAVVVVMTTSVWAQHNHQAATQPATDSQPAVSGDKVAACHHHMSEVKETLAKLDAAVIEAQQANTPAKTQAALDQVRSLADQLKKHISMCPMMQSKSGQEMDGMSCMGNETQKDSRKD